MPHCKKQMISFFLTTKCNLRCIYCYNADEREKVVEKTLPFNIAAAGIDYYYATQMSRHIRFYGPGEPTCEPELMKAITEYAKEKDSHTTVELQTNGAFSPQVREWILNNTDVVWVSFDGPPDIHNKNRPMHGGQPSSPVIEENVRWLIEHGGKTGPTIGVRVTITDNNVERQIEMVDYFGSLGVQYIWTDPVFQSVGNRPTCNGKSLIDLDKYVEQFMEAHHYAEKQSVFYGSFLTCNFDGETKVHCRACTPAPHLTPDGYLSACDMVLLGDQANHMECFIFGKWDKDTKCFILDEQKIHALQNRTVDTLPHCNTCEAMLYCGGYCLGEVVNETGMLEGQKPYVCSAIRKLFHQLGVCKTPYRYLHP